MSCMVSPETNVLNCAAQDDAPLTYILFAVSFTILCIMSICVAIFKLVEADIEKRNLEMKSQEQASSLPPAPKKQTEPQKPKNVYPKNQTTKKPTTEKRPTMNECLKMKKSPFVKDDTRKETEAEKATNDAVREQFGKLCKLLETPGWWIVTLRKEELVARRCRPHEKLVPGQFKLRAKKIGQTPVFGHFNMLAPAQADLMNVYRREIERLFDDPFIQKSIGPSQEELSLLERIRKCAELARREKLRREVEAELDALPDFNELLAQTKKDTGM